MIHWLTTLPNPRRGYRPHRHGADQGQIGWRLHAVRVEGEVSTMKEIRFTRALCGLQPVHGWGVDLFIDEECSRCWAAVEKAADEVAMEALRAHKRATR